MRAGLRIDVDTLRGTRLGVPRLLATLRRHGIAATFFFSVGPDNMGRHLWRLLRPAFLAKMLRTSAPSLYGWSILRCGVIGRGPDIGRECGDVIRQTAGSGHEVGLHAWDHQRWQAMAITRESATAELEKGYSRLAEILGRPPSCSAAPAWRAPVQAIEAKIAFPFAYNSDCRGTDCFLPITASGAGQPQIPVTLPTYDEMLGVDGIGDENYNDRLLGLFQPNALNVLCIHAEVEGIAKAELFEDFLVKARERNIVFERLDETLRSAGILRPAQTAMATISGREGLLCRQGRWV